MAITPRPRTTAQRPDLTRRLTPAQMKQGTVLPKHLTENPQALAQALRRPTKATSASLNPTYAPGQGQMDTETMNNMLMHQAPQDAPASMYAPGAPLPAIPGINPPAGPRQYDYPVGYNIAQLPRSSERTSFDQLRALADLYNGIRMCERVWYDVLNRLELSVTMAPGVIPDGETDTDAKWQKIIRPAYEFLSYPDGERSYHDWLIASTEDVLEIGQSAVYLNTNRKGDIISLDVIDGATIKPLLTQRGTMPRPPFPAYEQFIKGMPAGLYLGNTPTRPLTLSNIEIIREGARTASVYSRSRVEDIQLVINLALRKQNLDMARYTDGAVPAGIVLIKGDTAMTPDEVDEMERLINGQLGGNDRQKARLKFLPPGLVESIQITEQKDPDMTLDRFMLNVTVGAFGLTMDEISMTENSNRSVGDSQENVIYRRVVKTLTNRYAEFFTRILRRQYHAQLLVKWTGLDESEDLKAKADVLNIGVNAGAISRSYMARQMGWPVESEIPAFILAPGGASGIVVLDDIATYRQANLKGIETKQESSEAGVKIVQLQGEQLAQQLKQNQEQPPADTGTPSDGEDQGNEPPPEDGGDNGGGSSQGGDQGSSDDDAQAEAEIDQMIAEAKAKDGQRAQVTELARELDGLRAKVTPPPVALVVTPQPDPRAVSEEWAAWRTKALRLAKQGKPQAAFTVRTIPMEQHAWVAGRLSGVMVPDAVRTVFAEAREREAEIVRWGNNWQNQPRTEGGKFDPTDHGSTQHTVTYKSDGQAKLEQVFGRQLADHEIAALVGAQPGDKITVLHPQYTPWGGADAGVAVDVEFESPGHYYAWRTIERSHASGTLIMFNRYITVEAPHQGSGIGTRIFADQVRGASHLGVSEIRTRAERSDAADGNPPYNGYYTWPRLGYDGRIPDVSGWDHAPTSIENAVYFHEIMQLPEGRAWWKDTGTTVQVAFDLTPGSRSRQVLAAYLAERGMDNTNVERALRAGHTSGQRAEEIPWSAEDDAASDRAWDKLRIQWAAAEANAPDVEEGVITCPDCGMSSTDKTLTGYWLPGMVCPDCGHAFAAPDTPDAVVDELRMLRADVLRALE